MTTHTETQTKENKTTVNTKQKRRSTEAALAVRQGDGNEAAAFEVSVAELKSFEAANNHATRQLGKMEVRRSCRIRACSRVSI